MPTDILRDPAMRALVAAVMVSDAPEDLRVPSVAAAWAVDGVLGIVPAAVAAGQSDDTRSEADLSDVDRKYQEAKLKLDEDHRKSLEAERAARIAADRKLKAEKELNRCADAFLKAIKRLETDPEKQEQDLTGNIQAILDWLGRQGAAPPPPPPSKSGTAASAAQSAPSTEQAAPATDAAASAQTSGDAGKPTKK